MVDHMYILPSTLVVTGVLVGLRVANTTLSEVRTNKNISWLEKSPTVSRFFLIATNNCNASIPINRLLLASSLIFLNIHLDDMYPLNTCTFITVEKNDGFPKQGKSACFW